MNTAIVKITVRSNNDSDLVAKLESEMPAECKGISLHIYVYTDSRIDHVKTIVEETMAEMQFRCLVWYTAEIKNQAMKAYLWGEFVK